MIPHHSRPLPIPRHAITAHGPIRRPHPYITFFSRILKHDTVGRKAARRRNIGAIARTLERRTQVRLVRPGEDVQRGVRPSGVVRRRGRVGRGVGEETATATVAGSEHLAGGDGVGEVGHQLAAEGAERWIDGRGGGERGV